MWNLLFDAAVVGAHIQYGGEPFRQRDVRFLMDLFWNWQSSPVSRERLERVHNNQIKRGLEERIDHGFVQEVGKSKNYRMTRSGLIDGVSRIREAGLNGSIEAFLFSRFFFARYQDRISGLVEKNGAPLPLSFRMEIKDIFDIKKFDREKASRLKSEIQYYKARIEETRAAVSYVRSELKVRTPLSEIAAGLEAKYPYELNAQKPLTQLFATATSELQRSELTEGNEMRMEMLWTSYLVLLEAQVKLIGS